jgi:hypothetical protein
VAAWLHKSSRTPCKPAECVDLDPVIEIDDPAGILLNEGERPAQILDDQIDEKAPRAGAVR